MLGNLKIDAVKTIKKINQAVAEFSNQEDVSESQNEILPLFNDYSTADTIIKLKPSNQLIFSHSTILSKSPFFEACKNFKESNGYLEITPQCPFTAAECIEFLYQESTDTLST